uniref:Uncharacterized protein n=1 Tax=Pithovirus LCPAC403 TaxID=2506596 RepID=A0A481ZB08_9VIRU|nr:MAG: uncharacterized protein LCPAC403_02520 [Pithovirus LCPAC403]
MWLKMMYLLYHSLKRNMYQCDGFTKGKIRCKNRIRCGTRCYLHGGKKAPKFDRCRGIITPGEQCGINIPLGKLSCNLHSLIRFDMSIYLVSYDFKGSHYVGFFNSHEKIVRTVSKMQKVNPNIKFRISRKILNSTHDITSYDNKEICYTQHKLTAEISILKVQDLINIINEYIGIGFIFFYMDDKNNVSIRGSRISYITENFEKLDKFTIYRARLNIITKVSKKK